MGKDDSEIVRLAERHVVAAHHHPLPVPLGPVGRPGGLHGRASAEEPDRSDQQSASHRPHRRLSKV
jgi:hypothetical protein